MLLKTFFDAEAIIAGSASKSGASFILLQLCELNLLRGITCNQAIEECHRNIRAKLPQAMNMFKQIVSKSLQITENPTLAESVPYEGMAHKKDLSILVAAIKSQADFLVTFNTKHFHLTQEHLIKIIKPGELMHEIRRLLSESV